MGKKTNKIKLTREEKENHCLISNKDTQAVQKRPEHSNPNERAFGTDMT